MRVLQSPPVRSTRGHARERGHPTAPHRRTAETVRAQRVACASHQGGADRWQLGRLRTGTERHQTGGSRRHEPARGQTPARNRRAGRHRRGGGPRYPPSVGLIGPCRKEVRHDLITPNSPRGEAPRAIRHVGTADPARTPRRRAFEAGAEMHRQSPRWGGNQVKREPPGSPRRPLVSPEFSPTENTVADEESSTSRHVSSSSSDDASFPSARGPVAVAPLRKDPRLRGELPGRAAAARGGARPADWQAGGWCDASKWTARGRREDHPHARPRDRPLSPLHPLQ